MQKTHNAFDSLTAGKGRLYPTPSEKKKEWLERKQQFSWFTDRSDAEQRAAVPFLDGFIKVDQSVVDALQAAVGSSPTGVIRYNLEAIKQAGDDGQLKQVNLEYWIPKQQGGGSKPAQVKLEDDFDDDIPF
jgi:hypothetical protein